MTRALKYGNNWEIVRQGIENDWIRRIDGKHDTLVIPNLTPPSLTFVELQHVFRFGKPLFMGQKAWQNSMKRASTG